MLQLRGRLVPGFSLGAASSYGKASADLQSQVSDVVVKAGDAYYEADRAGFLLDYSDATKAYQAAGQAGASNVGAEIDAAGAASSTQPLTQQAWALNVQLAGLVRSGTPDPANGLPNPYYTQADADRARALVVQMIDLYSQAIVAGSQSSGQPVPQPSGPTPSPVPGAPQQPSPSPSSSSGGSSSPWLWLFPVAAAGGIFAAVVLQKGPRHAHA